jgi:ribonuclease HII
VVATPTLDRERGLLRAGARLVIGIDEVGRGAIAGPVAVGVAVLHPEHPEPPEGVRDSKLLSQPRREALHPLVQEWTPHSAVGVVSAADVDRIGIIASLGLAATRALGELHRLGVGFDGAVALLDGSHDWLTPALPPAAALPRVITQTKADRDCTLVAAASILAKVHRDRIMIAAHDEAPGYGWAGNKGYASAGHYAAIDELGPHALHRLSWLRTSVELPGLESGAA